MTHDALTTLLACWATLWPAMTRPSLRNFVVVPTGWAVSGGRHRISDPLCASGVGWQRHHCGFYRLFSRANWQPDTVGKQVFRLIESLLLPLDAALCLAIDDTLAHHSGPKIFGIGSHLDAVRSTRATKVSAFGHVWVVIAVVVTVPFSSRPWALPVAMRLYRHHKTCERTGAAYRSKTEMAPELIELVASWRPLGRIETCADMAYCNATVFDAMPERVVLFGAMRNDAVLTKPAEPVEPGKRRRGRPAIRGAVLQKPVDLAKDESVAWQVGELRKGTSTAAVQFKWLDAQWYTAFGARLLRVVVVKLEGGKDELRSYFCADPNVLPNKVLQGDLRRWSVECLFRDAKQDFGLDEPQVRKQASVERMAPAIALHLTLLVLWYVQVWQTVKRRRQGPWYHNKREASMADIVYAAAQTRAGRDPVDLANVVEETTKQRPLRPGQTAALPTPAHTLPLAQAA